MIKATELRIGNLIQHRYLVDKSIFIEVVSINKRENDSEINIDENGSYYSINDMDGIPLTEDWLLKFGFFRNGGKYFTIGSEPDFELYDYSHGEMKSIRTNFYHSTEIQYVHQLQNLYFSLTGEELTIKQDAEKATS